MAALATSSMPVARYAVDLVDRAAPAAVTPATLAVAVLLADQAAVPAEVLAAAQAVVPERDQVAAMADSVARR